MKVVALDIATRVGIAAGEAGGTPSWREVDLGEAPDARRFSNVLRLAHELIVEEKPDLLMVEAAIGGPKASAYLIGLVACVEGCAWNRGVRVERAYLAAIRKHFVGKVLNVSDFPHLKQADAKRAIKAEVIRRCHILGWKVDTSDEADACALWDYGCAVHGRAQSVPVGGLFQA
jgi:hypothetical protein